MKLVWFSEIRWDYMTTRKQQILPRLPKEWKILFVEPYTFGKSMHWLPAKRDNIIVVGIPFLKNYSKPKLMAFANRKPVQLVIESFGYIWLYFWLIALGFYTKKRVIGLSSVNWGRIASRMKADVKFYDCNDNHLAFGVNPVWAEPFLQKFLGHADFAFFVSPELESFIKKLAPVKTITLGNGVEFDHFATPKPKPVAMERFGKPVLGYVGAMDWLDINLIEKIANHFPEYEIILLGPEISPGWWNRQTSVSSMKNSHYLGKIPYADLPAYVQQFRVALIPFVCNELTRALNPNKLYEYCATGKPVVTMNYSSTIDNLRQIIYVSDSIDEFIRNIEQALTDENTERRQEFAKQHDWSVIAEKMAETIRNYRKQA
ncbi:MAG: glycosyltransferase family 1 protein [Candidatus Marinimicrobia bacterium CG08_land_8_20_14_0_20_45_22]|nr:MAG: glycosyltransferase family 1 protein [Candidatus Marinimicrobia bacterium CG08_land_8_20_14_0_20_45_22]